MSSVDGPPVSRGLLIALGAVVGLALLALGWVGLVQPLLGGDEVAQVPVDASADPTLPPAVLPDGDPVAPLPEPAQPDPDALADIDTLIELGEVSEEVFQIAGARDPFRQVVVEAQVAPPGAATVPATPTTAPPSTGTPATGTPSTGTPATGAPATDSPTAAPSTGEDTDPATPGVVGPDGITELAATGLQLGAAGPGALALLALVASTLGIALVRRPIR